MRVLLVAPVPPPYGGVALQARQLEALLRREGLEVERFASNFALTGVLRPLGRIPGVRTLARVLLIWFRLLPPVRRADVVHVFAASWLYFFLVVYPAVLVARACRKRVVLNYRGGEAGAFFRRFHRLISPVFRVASSVTAPSEFLAAIIREQFGVAVSIVPNIVDTSVFPYRLRTAIRPALLVTRHLEKIYDIESILKAFRIVQRRHPDASLTIAGSGSEEPYLRDLAAAWRLANVHFLGEVAHANLPEIYDRCDIYINASRVDNFPGALIEASASGLAVVTTGAGGIPFIYEHGKTAFLVEPGDWQGLARAVEQVLEHPGRTVTVTRAAERVARACDWTAVRNRLFEAYEFRTIAAGAQTGVEGSQCAAG